MTKFSELAEGDIFLFEHELATAKTIVETGTKDSTLPYLARYSKTGTQSYKIVDIYQDFRKEEKRRKTPLIKGICIKDMYVKRA